MPKIAQGIYKRGKTYWYRFQQNGKRLAVSLKTEDEQQAIARAALVKTNAPVPEPVPKALRTGDTFPDQVDRYLAAKNETGSHTAATKDWSKRALLQFGAFILNKSAKSVKAEDISGFYAQQRSRLQVHC
jgi:cell division protein FtsN